LKKEIVSSVIEKSKKTKKIISQQILRETIGIIIQRWHKSQKKTYKDRVKSTSNDHLISLEKTYGINHENGRSRAVEDIDFNYHPGSLR